MRKVVRSVVVAVLAFVVVTMPSVARGDGRVALVVGNSTYAHIGRLQNPDNDARDISAALRPYSSLAEVTAALGAGASRRTAFRRLKDIDARTSYSHRGGYYTLDELAHFDERCL